MAKKPIFSFTGTFTIATDNPNLAEITKALNETGRGFADIIKWRSDGEYRGYMYFVSDIDIELPIVELSIEDNFTDGTDSKEESEVEDEDS